MKRKVILLAVIFTIITAAQAAAQTAAQELQNLFPPFLAILAERNEELNSLAMPDVETLTVPGFEGEALYMVYFKTSEDKQCFYTAVVKEEIPCLTFSSDDKRIGLFHTDLFVFIMKAAIGL